MKGNSFFRRLLALTLSVVLVLSLGATALANEDGEGDTLDEIQVEGLETSGEGEETGEKDEPGDANGGGNAVGTPVSVEAGNETSETPAQESSAENETGGTQAGENGSDDTTAEGTVTGNDTAADGDGTGDTANADQTEEQAPEAPEKAVFSATETETGGTISEITESGVIDGDTITVSRSTLQWYAVDQSVGRYQDGWWVGVKITAPSTVTSENVSSVTYSNDGGTTWKSFDTYKDGDYWIGCWVPISPTSLETAASNGSVLTKTYKFNWDGDKSTEPQTFTITIDPSNITLVKDSTIAYQTVDGKMAVKDGKTVVAIANVDGTNTYYTDINEAVKAGGTVTLLADVSDVTIPSETSVTIDLNGHTISSVNDHAITNNGTLTVIGTGTVDGGSTSGKGALYNAPGATATLKGGTFTGSKWYVIKNLGTMTIDGATITQNDAGSSGIDNGYYGGGGVNDCYVTYPSSATVTLTIKSGSFSGGMNTVKNDDFGVLTIEGGTFTNTSGPLVLNWNKATISGGTFTSTAENSAVLANGYCGTADVGQMTIIGGTFTASGNGAGSLLTYPLDSSEGKGTLTIEGGIFTGAWPADTSSLPYTVDISGGNFSAEVPKEYCAEGYAPKENPNGTYGVHVHTAEKTKAKAATCTEPGNTAYWYCAECDKYFSDEDLTEEITQADTVTKATGHSLKKVDAQEATEDTNGNIEYWYCTVCGQCFSDEDMSQKIDKEDTIVSADWNGLKLDVSANKTSVRAGRTIIYTLTVTNNTGVTLTDIQVSNDVDKNLTFSYSSSSSYDSGTGVWTISKLANGETATLTLKYKVKSGVDSGTKLTFNSTLKYTKSDNSYTKTITDSVTVKVSNKTSILPDTGDTSRIGMWVGVLVAAAVALGAILVLFTVKKKKAR